MLKAYFVSDLHGSMTRYEKLFSFLKANPPDALFMGGDLFPGATRALFHPMSGDAFIEKYLAGHLDDLKQALGDRYPAVFLILGNDDGRFWEPILLDMAVSGYWHYMNFRHLVWQGFDLYGYNYVPPTPFRLKDWERYDVSRFVDPGCTAPSEGMHTVPVSDHEMNWATMAEDLERMTSGHDLQRAIMLFHAPPYQTALDRAALDGKMIDYAPLDVHVGSIAIRRFIEEKQPMLTLHGHVHESCELTGSWRQDMGRTLAVGAAHNGPELALVVIPLGEPRKAQRLLL